MSQDELRWTNISKDQAKIGQDVTKVTQALVGSRDSSRDGDIQVHGDAKVDANSDGFIIGSALTASWATGKVAPSGQSEPPVENSDYGISVSGAFIFNSLDSTTRSGLYNLTSFNANKLTVESHERSGVYAFPIAYASASANKIALAAAGIGLVNDIELTVSAEVDDVSCRDNQDVTM